MAKKKTNKKPTIPLKALIDSLERRIHFLEDSLNCLTNCGHEFEFHKVESSPVDNTVKFVIYKCLHCSTEKTRTITRLSENERKKLAGLGYSLRR